METKKKFSLVLPEGMVLPEGAKLPEIETETAKIRKTKITDDGRTTEIEQTIEVPVIPDK